MIWIILAIFSAAFSALSAILAKKALNKIHAYEVLLGSLFLSTFLGLPFLYGVDIKFGTIWWLLLLKGIIYGIASFLITKSTRHLEISESEPLHNLTPLFLVILAPIFLNESVPFMALMGIFLLLLGTYWLELISHSHKSVFDMGFLKNYYVILMLVGVAVLAFSPILDKMIVPQLGWQVTLIFG